MSLLLGAFLLYGIPAIVGGLFWGGVAWWVRILEGRDVMTRFRPHRKDVLRAEKELGLL